MDQITCKHCGTKYPADVAKCPVCGASNLPNVSGDFEFLDDDFEVKGKETAPEKTDVPAEPAAPAAPKESVAKDTGAYNWEDIIAEINGTKPEDKESPVEETEEKPAPEEPKKAAPTAMPAWKQSSADKDDDDDEDDEDEDEPRPVRRPRERKQKSKTGSTVLIVVLIAAVIVAAFFAAKHFGIFDKKEPEQEPETPELPVVQEQDVDCTGVTLSANTLTLTAEGASETLTATLSPADCTEKVNWVSADPSIAIVDGSGKVTAVAEGTANILVSCGDYAATCLVTVDFTPEEGGEEPEDIPGTAEPAEEGGEMKLNHEDITIRYPGDQVQLQVENCGDKAVTWTSDNETILKVDETGLVTALGTGTTNVHAEVDGQTFSCIVRLPLGGTEGEAVTVSLNSTDISMFYEGEQFKLEVKYEQGAPEGATYEWKSADESVCTVDADGIITAVGNGTTDVLTTVNGVVLRCIVRVRIETPTTEG